MSRRNARSSATPRCVNYCRYTQITGYDVMAHLTMEFFTKGLVPITSLSFGYKQGHLEPIFILGKNNKQKIYSMIQRLEANRRKFNKDK